MPEINFNEFKKNLSQEKKSNIYMLSGEEYLVSYCKNAIEKNFFQENELNDFNKTYFSGENNLNLSQIEVAIETLPINSEKKCVIINNISWGALNEEDIQNLTNLINDIPEYCIFIICNSSTPNGKKEISKFKKIQKTITEKGIYVNLDSKDIPLEKQLIFWAKKEYDKELPSEYSKLIIKLCPNTDIKGLKNELEKICLKEKENVITKDSISIISEYKSKRNIFDLPKSLFSKNYKKSLDILEELFDQKEDPIGIVAVLSSEYIDLYRVKIYTIKNENPMNLKNIFDYKNKEFRIKNAEQKSKNIRLENIIKSLEYLIDADSKLKSTTINPKLIVEELLIKLIKNYN
ncbi:MAG: DNA polymerase III subunit delta [Clostridia bacterium]|nr:DNA polymerase III subunit delta [Clostridia bacterium]